MENTSRLDTVVNRNDAMNYEDVVSLPQLQPILTQHPDLLPSYDPQEDDIVTTAISPQDITTIGNNGIMINSPTTTNLVPTSEGGKGKRQRGVSFKRSEGVQSRPLQQW